MLKFKNYFYWLIEIFLFQLINQNLFINGFFISGFVSKIIVVVLLFSVFGCFEVERIFICFFLFQQVKKGFLSVKIIMVLDLKDEWENFVVEQF